MATIKYYSIIRLYTQKKEEMIQEEKIASVLKVIRSRYGSEVYKLCKKSVILVNGENVAHRKGHATKIKENDMVKILPVTGGG